LDCKGKEYADKKKRILQMQYPPAKHHYTKSTTAG